MSVTDIDPKRHLLSSRRYFRDTQDAPTSTPVTFAEEATECRQDLAAETGAGAARSVAITGVEALVSAALLKEFAARLRHDIERGVLDPEGEQLATVAGDLSDRLYRAGGLTD